MSLEISLKISQGIHLLNSKGYHLHVILRKDIKLILNIILSHPYTESHLTITKGIIPIGIGDIECFNHFCWKVFPNNKPMVNETLCGSIINQNGDFISNCYPFYYDRMVVWNHGLPFSVHLKWFFEKGPFFNWGQYYAIIYSSSVTTFFWE